MRQQDTEARDEVSRSAESTAGITENLDSLPTERIAEEEWCSADAFELLGSFNEPEGRYVELEEYARGGMGRILLVQDRVLEREVAFKQMLPAEGEDASLPPPQTAGTAKDAEARFVREARLTGQLEHPSIVPVHEIGRRKDGSLYYTMKLIRGRTLKAAFDDAKSLVGRLALLPHFVDLCQAIAYAHSRGVIHRDIKPTNVLIGEFGETVVIDWGLAKLRSCAGASARRAAAAERGPSGDAPAAPALTQHGQFVGTPHYASPEQALGKIEEIAEPSDVYALGAVLYQLLTGSAPFHGKTVRSIIEQVVQGRVRPVRELEPNAPPELVAICERAMNLEASRRYRNAKELVDELKRFQTGALVSAYEYGLLDRLRRFVRKHRTGLAVTAASVVLLVAVGSVAFVRVLQEKRLTEQALYRSSISLAKQAVDTDQIHEARLALADAPAWCRNWEWGLLERMSHPANSSLVGHTGPVNAGVFSPDGAYIATASADATARIWNAATGKPVLVLRGHTDSVSDVDYAENGTRLVTTADDGTVRVWDTSTGAELMVLNTHTMPMTAYTDVSADSTRIVTGTGGYTATVWDLRSGVSLASLDGHTNTLYRSVFSHSGRLIATASLDHTARLWDSETGQCIRFLGEHPKAVFWVTFSPDDRMVATACADGAIRLIDVETGTECGLLTGHTASARAVIYTADGLRLVSASEDRTIRVWDLASGKQVGMLGTFPAPFYTFDLSPDGSHVFTRDEKGSAACTSLTPSEGFIRLKGHTGTVNGVAFSRDGLLVATAAGHWEASDDNRAIVWDAATGQIVTTLGGHRGSVTCLAFLSRDNRLITGGADATAILWDTAKATPIRTFAGHSHQIRALSLSPDERRFATASWDYTALVWDIESGEKIATLKGCEDVPDGITFSPDGGQVVTGSRDGRARFWDAGTGRLLRVFDPKLTWVWALAYSPNGLRLAMVGSARADQDTAMIFDADSLRLRTTLRGHTGRVAAVAWSPDGRRIVTGGVDATIRVWDPDTGRELLRLNRHTDRVKAAAFSPDGRTLVTGSYDMTAILWPSAPWNEPEG